MIREGIGEEVQHHAVDDDVGIFYGPIHTQIAEIPYPGKGRIKLPRREASVTSENDVRPTVKRLALRFVYRYRPCREQRKLSIPADFFAGDDGLAVLICP